MSDVLADMVRSLRTAKDAKKALEAAVKVENAKIRELSEHKIPEYMEENEIDKHGVAGVGTVFLQTKVYANVKAENRDDFHAWLRANDNGDLIKETVHPSTLNAFAKEQLAAGVALPDALDARLYPTAILRKT